LAGNGGSPQRGQGNALDRECTAGQGGKSKKGSDKSIDGVINYIDSAKQDLKRVLVQVKSGHVNSATVCDLRGFTQREGAEIGILVTLEPLTKDMIYGRNHPTR
jgi:Restriction endonuclease